MHNDFLDCEPAPLVDIDDWDEEPTSEHPAALPPIGDMPTMKLGEDFDIQCGGYGMSIAEVQARYPEQYEAANRLRGELLFAIGQAETKQQQAEAREAVALDVLAAIVGRFKDVAVTVGPDGQIDWELIMAAERLLRERR